MTLSFQNKNRDSSKIGWKSFTIIALCSAGGFLSQGYAQESASEPDVDVSTLQTTVVDSAGPRSKPRVTSTDARVSTTTTRVVDEVVVSPTRTAKLIEDVPVSIGVISVNEIAQIAPLSFDDLVRSEPNVEFGGGPRYLGEQLIVRGEGGNAVTVRIDDGRQNFVSGHSGQRFFVETDFLNEVEILRGGGSFLYGSGSAGVLNLSTLDPEHIIRDGNHVGFRLRDTYQTNTDEWAHSLIGATGNDLVKVLVGVSQRDGDNIELGGDKGELAASSIERESAMGKLVFTPNDETRFELGITGYDSEDLGGANPQQLTVGTIDNDLVKRVISYTQIYGDWSFNPEFNDLVDIKASIYQNNTSQRRMYTGDGNANNIGRSNVHDLDVFGIDINNRSVIYGQHGVEHELVYGIDYFKEKQDGSETRDAFFIPGSPGNSSGRPDAEASHLGLFITDEIDITEKLTLFSGLRFDSYNSEKTIGSSAEQSGSAVLPQVGFDFDATDRLSFFGQFSKGFTSPTLNNLYADGSHYGNTPTAFHPVFMFPTAFYEEFFIPNPDLQPEKSDNFELGFHFEDDDFASGRLSSRFTSFIKNGENTFDTEVARTQMIPNSPFPGATQTNAFIQTINRAETQIYGFEYSTAYDADTWFAGLDIGVLRGEDTTTGRNLNNITGDQLALTLGTRPTENTEIGIRGLWNGGRKHLVDFENSKTGGYDIYGIFGSWQINDFWTLRGGIDNIFDQSYERTSVYLGEQGRNAFISSTIEW